MADSRAGWDGSVQKCASALASLFVDGKIRYVQLPSGPADDGWIIAHTSQLQALFKEIPKGNGNYSMFVKSILMLMNDGSYGNMPTNRQAQLKEAEEMSTSLRTICFHVRREWYRRSSKPWLAAFPRPVEAAQATQAVVAAPDPQQVPEASVPHCNHAATMLRACHGESPDLYDLMLGEMSVEESMKEESMEEEEEDSAADGLVYIYGFDVESNGNNAWRVLVDNTGAEVDEKEYASHCSEPPGGVGLMIGNFLDGTTEQIPGMLFQKIRKRPASASTEKTIKAPRVQKKPAAAPAVAVVAIDDLDTIEEHAEEELDFVPDEEIEVETLLYKYVETHSLSDNEMNGKYWFVEEERGDGRVRINAIPPAEPNSFWASPDKLKEVTKKQLIASLVDSMDIDGVHYSIKAKTQGCRACLVLVTTSTGQFGQVSEVTTGDDIVQAFQMAMSVMRALEIKQISVRALSGENGASVTKQAFFEHREALMSRQ